MKIAARFTATPINPFAPAIVHLDASATTAEGVARPFHELEAPLGVGHVARENTIERV